ncbi:heme biosynthesis HemY N-terminal domain-containing protein [Pokkaliibacter sp. CJK22405]|uniref:heme biosynthesis HemY N-terminal domain-containing protein n=1 Tax=Pokkaliibacter sp. CJK22405 TaxID=3384615 RepID=UPI003984E0F9
MKKAFLFIIAILLLGTWIGYEMTQDSGYVLIAFKSWTVETSLWTAAVLMLLIFMVAHGLLRLFYKVRLPGERLRRWRSSRQQANASVKTHRGLLALADGRWKQAERWLTQSATASDMPMINYLAAARAAQEQGHDDKADKWLQKAQETTKGADIAVGLTQAELMLQRGEYVKARALLLTLRKQSPRHTQVLRMLKTCCVELKDWKGLCDLIIDLKRNEAMDLSSLKLLEADAWRARLKEAGRNKEATDEARIQEILDTWQAMPINLQEQTLTLQLYVERLMDLSAIERAEIVIRNAVNQQWNDELVYQYGLIQSPALDRQLSTAEKWLKQHPDNAVLLLTLGRLSIQCGQWQKARQYLESSLTKQPRYETLQELARLLLHLGEQVSSTNLLLRHADLLNQDLPQLPMPQK